VAKSYPKRRLDYRPPRAFPSFRFRSGTRLLVACARRVQTHPMRPEPSFCASTHTKTVRHRGDFVAPVPADSAPEAAACSEARNVQLKLSSRCAPPIADCCVVFGMGVIGRFAAEFAHDVRAELLTSSPTELDDHESSN
jgi:threonine dehydrogenase-like Zn-dependent dehydrogenase